ncbi:hypothetical protein [Oecophyllibacter saccharovorans]|uniref:hypothetical protein n=1 Tax=Oecophyllibacter saccharovorans TaxID=2558360 RepID=UPI001F5002E4|nr:hypothetical protein [Oecophyllibacter saccharovorans]
MTVLAAGLGLALGTALPSNAAHAAAAGAMSARQCHQAFQAAKKDGSLNGQTYAAFKVAKCQTADVGAATPAGSGAAASGSVPAGAVPEAKTSENSDMVKPSAAAAVTTTSAAGVVFPQAIAPEFSKLTPGKARLQTCAAQYRANKPKGANGQLKWIQKGGGYWSQCNAHLKAATP